MSWECFSELVARFLSLLPAMGLILILSFRVQAKEIDPPLAGGTPDQSPLHGPEPAVARLLHELQGFTDSEPSRVAKAQAQAGDPAAARATLRKALQVADESVRLLWIGQVQAEMGDRDAALKTLLRARQPDMPEVQPPWGRYRPWEKSQLCSSNWGPNRGPSYLRAGAAVAPQFSEPAEKARAFRGGHAIAPSGSRGF